MTSALTPLPLAAVRTDPKVQMRSHMDTLVVRDYAAALRTGAIFPPIIVYREGDDYWLADGHHRLEAGRQAGLTEKPESRCPDGVFYDLPDWLSPSSSGRKTPVPAILSGSPCDPGTVVAGPIPRRWKAVARTSFGEPGVSTTSPACVSVAPTRFPRR